MQNIAETITVRPTIIADAPVIYQLYQENNFEFDHQFLWYKNEAYSITNDNFLTPALAEVANGNLYMASILINGQLIGQVYIFNIDHINHRGQINFWLDVNFRGQGIMTKTVRDITDFAFKTLNLHRLELWTDIRNEASQDVVRRLSWKREAVVNEYLASDDGYQDVILFAKVNKKG